MVSGDKMETKSLWPSLK